MVTTSRLRPLARRRLRTLTPSLVRIRTRKPWVLFRRILLGWYVRFMIYHHSYGIFAKGIVKHNWFSKSRKENRHDFRFFAGSGVFPCNLPALFASLSELAPALDLR